MLGDTQLEKGFGIGGGAFMQCMSPAQFAGGAGVNISKGQQVWLCWDLEPAADVLLCSGCFLLERGGRGGSPLNLLGYCVDTHRGQPAFQEVTAPSPSTKCSTP